MWFAGIPNRHGIRRSRATGHAEEHRLKGKGEMDPIGTLKQFGLAPPMKNANPLPGVRRCIDRPLAERADEPLSSGHGLEPDRPKSAYGADISEHQPMLGTGGAAAETPDRALVDFPVVYNIFACAGGAPGQQRPMPKRRFGTVGHDKAQRPDPRCVETCRLRKEMLQLGVFPPVEREKPQDMNARAIPKPRHQFRRRQIVSCSDTPNP